MKVRYSIVLCLAFLICMPQMYAQRSPKRKVVASKMIHNPQAQDSLNIKKAIGKYIKGYHWVFDDNYFTTLFSHRNYQNRNIISRIEELLKRDVIGYNSLANKYDSPLKRKVFMQSQEYQILFERLEKEYNYLLEDTFYISSKISKTDYDLNKKSFSFSVPTSDNYSNTRYIRFNSLGIVSPLLKGYELQIKIEDEQIALAVENNYQDCRLVYVFTINGSLSEKDETHTIGDLQKLFLINVKNGKTYFYGIIGSNADSKKATLKQYDHDIYVRAKKIQGYEVYDYYLKTKDGYVKLADEEELGYEDYRLEEKDGMFFVTSTTGKKYQLSFKPLGVVLAEKDAAYEVKCEEIKDDYLSHPENYEDVTKTDAEGVVHSYTDKEGNEWILESENRGFHLLEKDNVYILFEEQKFIRRK